MTFLGGCNAVLRYIGRFLGKNLTSNAMLEAQWYLFSAIFLLGAGHVLTQERHVRVDVLYERFSQKYKTYIDIGGTVCFLIPLCLFGIWSSWDFALESWTLQEVSADAGGLIRYPVKTLVPLSFLFLGIHAVLYIKNCLNHAKHFRRIKETTEAMEEGE